MDRPNDPFWNDVEDMNDGSMKCKFCGHKFASDTSISSIKWHLSGERGHGVSICGQVPKEVQEAAFLAMRGGNKRHKSIPSSSNVNDYAIPTFPQEQDNAGDAGRMQVGVQGMENTGDGSFQHVDRSVSPSRLGVDAHESRGEAAQGTDEWSYDVFLSFRGEDTRKTITDHLYSALNQAEIRAFRDDNDLPRGEEISPQLLRAIEGSRISVVVFSRNYASSRWCLDELVKIMECRQKTHQVVLPTFYDTDPSYVRKQTGSYAKAFDEHEKNFKGEMEKVNRWRKALTEAANLSGRVLHETNGYEAEFIKRVVSDVACKLGNKTLHVAKHPVGISSKEMNMVRGSTEPMEEHDVENSGILVQPGAGARSSKRLKYSKTRGVPFSTSSNKPVGQAFEENTKVIWSLLMDDEVPTIGIYGMGGVGKTTILQHIHNELLQRPDICDHIWWVTVSQDFSINRLQNLIAKRLNLDLSSEDDDLHRAARLSEELRNKQKWILILDDLWNNFELHEVGIPIPLKGCKLILTTRSRMVCARIACQHKIEVKPLFEGESWTLFKENLERHIAFSDEVEGIAKAVARECAGLPLGIITVAGSLRGVDDLYEWRNTLKKLKELTFRDMDEKVFKVLRVSLDLFGTSLEKMPLGMECLCNLRYFRITGCGEKEFPSGILSKLSHLQVFALGEFPTECYTVEGMEVGCLGKLETLQCHFKGFSDFVEYLTSRDGIQSLSTYKILVGTLDRYSSFGSNDFPGKAVRLGNLSINRDRDFQVKFLNGIQGLYCESIDARSLCDVLSLENATELEIICIQYCDSMESLVSSSWFCSAPPPMPSHNGMFSRLKEFWCIGCNSMGKLFPLELLSYLVNLEVISVRYCERMEEIIGTTDEESSTSNPITELTLPKLTYLELCGLPGLKGICSAKLICNSLEAIDVKSCKKLKRMAISLPLLENGQPSPHPSFKRIVCSKEWWETVVEWEPPNAKEVLRPIVHFW